MFAREETIILNVGGVKYETYPSTLTAFPDTLLGTMFQERNREMLHPKNGNEYFIDRNGYAFRYILEFYRNGKILWSDRAEKNLVAVTREELNQEIDYFQLPIKDAAVTSGELTVASKVDAFVAALKKVVHIAINQLQTEIQMAITDFGTIEELEWYPAQGQSEIIADIMKPFNMVGFVILRHFGDAIERHIKSEIPEFSWRCEFYNCKPRRGYGALMSPYQSHNHSFLNNSFNNMGFNGGISRMSQPNMMTFQHIINANNNTSTVSSWPTFNQNNNQQNNLNNVAHDVNGITRLFGNNTDGFNSNSISQAVGGQGTNFGVSQTPLGFGANQADGNVQTFGGSQTNVVNGPNFNGDRTSVNGQQFGGNSTNVNGQAPGPPTFSGNQATGDGPAVNGPFVGGGNQATGSGPFGSGTNNHFGQYGSTFNVNQTNNNANGQFGSNQNVGFGYGTTPFINQSQGYGSHTITGYAGGHPYSTAHSSPFGGSNHTVTSYNGGGQTYVPLHSGYHAFVPTATHDSDTPSMFYRRAEGRALKLVISHMLYILYIYILVYDDNIYLILISPVHFRK
ncbi:unnamed protein product [Rhizophagus irregularis]|nr:unnamed protein product [Rhizophagus irregularis]CAB5388360.1 unnamed protein product [Rhizophagus irregularis]